MTCTKNGTVKNDSICFNSHGLRSTGHLASPFPLCSTSNAPGWVGSVVGSQPFSDPFRDAQLDTGPSQSCPEATTALAWLCASARCPTQRWTSSPVWYQERCFICPSILTGLPVPATEKHPNCLMLPPPCLHGDGNGLVMSRIVFLMVCMSFRCLLVNSRRAAMCLLQRSGFHLAVTGLIDGLLQRWNLLLQRWNLCQSSRGFSGALTECSPAWQRPFSPARSASKSCPINWIYHW